MIDKNSLGNTIDVLNDGFFFNKKLSDKQKHEAALWIASRQGLPGSYAGMFAPTEDDFKNGVQVFTGEKITTGAGTAHILGEEACRILVLLNVDDTKVKTALKKTQNGMVNRLNDSQIQGYSTDLFCCGPCTIALWRNLIVGGLNKQKERLKAGLKEMKILRDGKGRWRRFRFYYALLALHEIDLEEARDELIYARPAMERALNRNSGQEKYQLRKLKLLELILKKMH
ncbi:MAG: hypothetical protein JW794_08810 [Candidatus Cloacimonetes bacterium]|nr:hypothetical protein [Candidatus Cloacimonadota bacterium]